MKNLIWALALSSIVALSACLDDSNSNTITQAELDEQIIETYLAENNITDYSKTDFGVYYHPITAGTGMAIPADSIIDIGYKGFLPYGHTFDNSFARQDTISLLKSNGALVSSYDTINCVVSNNTQLVLCDSCPNFDGGVIAGWVEAMTVLNVGDRTRFYIPSGLGYGGGGSGSIPPNAVLVFDIEAYGYRGYSDECP